MNKEIAGTIERALVVANPHSANAARVSRQIRRLPLPVSIIESSCDPRITEANILDNAREGDLVIGACGDGTSNMVLNILMGEEAIEKGIDGLPFLPLRGGNANDTACMLNGRKAPDRILKEGKLISVNPLEITVNPNDPGTLTRYALGYFGVGATASASMRLEDIKRSSNAVTKKLGLQLGREALHAFFAVRGFEPFTVNIDGEDQNPVSEMLFLKGNRMAKVAKTHAELDKPHMEVMSQYVRGAIGTLAAMFNLATGKIRGELTHRAIFSVQSADGSPLPVQYDGEADIVRSGSALEVRVSPSPYRTISTRIA
jgi:diacylglycerol kinase family enzyme